MKKGQNVKKIIIIKEIKWDLWKFRKFSCIKIHLVLKLKLTSFELLVRSIVFNRHGTEYLWPHKLSLFLAVTRYYHGLGLKLIVCPHLTSPSPNNYQKQVSINK